MVAVRARLRLALAVVLILLACLRPVPAAEAQVDLELVLAVDVSGSMDLEEQRLQRAGYAVALTHPEVLRAISAGAYGCVAIAYVESAGRGRAGAGRRRGCIVRPGMRRSRLRVWPGRCRPRYGRR